MGIHVFQHSDMKMNLKHSMYFVSVWRRSSSAKRACKPTGENRGKNKGEQRKKFTGTPSTSPIIIIITIIIIIIIIMTIIKVIIMAITTLHPILSKQWSRYCSPCMRAKKMKLLSVAVARVIARFPMSQIPTCR
jgi:hypothetical protein